jgi:amidase
VDTEELAFAGIARQAELIRAGEVSSRELVELYLERIERLNPELNVFTDVLADSAVAEADAADGRRGGGEELPLLGVPVALKDNADVAGVPTRYGSRGYDETPAAGDGEAVRRLRAAGAVILAKTTLSELAILPFTETEGWGKSRNPWDTGRSVGGSSGGSAGAVAAGLVGVASATDGGGSIRIPAAFCGLFGLKPQRGRVPMEPHDHWNSLSAAGCVSRTVADTGLYLDVVTAGGGDPAGPEPPEQSFAEAARTTPGRLRIAISDKPARAILPPVVSDEAKAGLADTEQVLRSLGHDVRRHDPSYGLAGNNFVARYLGGIRDDVEAVPHPERIEKRTRGFGRLGRPYAGGMARRATRAAAADAQKINASWSEFDVLVTPTVGETAVEIGRWAGNGALRTLLSISRTYCFTPIWNHTGQPAAAVPAGFTAKGMPRSVTLVSPPGGEATLLSLAAQIEAERPWADRLPPVS